MRHKKLNKRLGRNKSQRKQLMRSLVRALFISYRIETTVEKAKEARKLAEKMITYAKSGQLKDIRAMERVLQNRALVSNIIKVVAPLAMKRKGGYTRIIRSGFRRGDGASLAILELTDMPVIEKKAKKYKKQKPVSKAVPEEDAKAKKPVKKQAIKSTKSATREKAVPAKSVEVKKQELKEKVKEEKAKDVKKAAKPEKFTDDKKSLLGKLRGFLKKDKY